MANYRRKLHYRMVDGENVHVPQYKYVLIHGL